MHDFMDTLALDAVKTVKSGYYKNIQAAAPTKISFKEAIKNCRTNPVITEIKPASPSMGTIRSVTNREEVAEAMQRGGAVGLSILTEPIHFNGSLKTLTQARNAVKLPLLMKDIIITTEQVEAGAKLGANAVLLIQALFDRGYCELDLIKTIGYAHNLGLEVLLETHTEAEFKKSPTNRRRLDRHKQPQP